MDYKWKILRPINVVDGDTFDVSFDKGFSESDERRFRLLAGIGVSVNAPETHGPKASENGRRVVAFVAGWFIRHSPAAPTGHQLWIQSVKSDSSTPSGSFGRWLGIITCDCGANLGADIKTWMSDNDIPEAPMTRG